MTLKAEGKKKTYVKELKTSIQSKKHFDSLNNPPADTVLVSVSKKFIKTK